MKTHPNLIATQADIAVLAEELSKHEIIAFDTEFIRETTFYPIVEIIQVATSDESWLVDAQIFKKGFRPGPTGGFDSGIQPLLDIFQNKKILKVVHAAQGDEECLFSSFGILATPIVDTAVVASLCGMGDGIGLGKLLKQVLNVEIKKGHARTNWSVRPLPEQLLEYAHADVEHLVKLGTTLLADADRLGRKQWALELSAKWEERSLYDTDLASLAEKLARGGRLDKRGYAALVELVKWREGRVRQLNMPRRWVADDAVLVDLANVRPKDLAHLSAFRGLNKGELKNSGEAILEAIERSNQIEGLTISRMPRPEIPTAEESQVLDLLKCYVGILADQHKIAAKHLMTTAQLLPLLRGQIDTPEDIVRAGILSEESARLIGNELIALLKGKRAFTVYRGPTAQIRIVEI